MPQYIHIAGERKAKWWKAYIMSTKATNSNFYLAKTLAYNE
jgi:hypothetical protein